MSNGSYTIREIRRTLIREISGIYSPEEAQSISRLILEHLGFSSVTLLREPSPLIDSKIHAEINKIVIELNKNIPIQYILGETEFFGLRIKVNRHVLIPRPETEELVSLVISNNKSQGPVIADLGTGSGCIAIALAKNLPDAHLYAIDIDSNALSTARGNALLNGVQIDFIQESIFNLNSLPGGKTDLIISNPPYVTLSEQERMSVRVKDFEPAIALFVPDNDPLTFYREIIRIARESLKENGSVWVEINESLGKETATLFTEAGFGDTVLIRDIHGKERFIKAKKQYG